VNLIIKLIKFFFPPNNWQTTVIILCGILTGLFLCLFYISNAPSYLSDSPTTCVNCHIMAPQYATWSHSSHREWTNCNACHVPQDNIFSHYYFKAMDGLRHATIFTLRKEPQVIQIKEAGHEVVQANCYRCHEHLLTDARLLRNTSTIHENRKNRTCWDCHRETPHGRVNSLSSAPFARVPLLSSPVPKWLKEIIK
jgi:cytochrome c nitrite reductase small subunit